MKNLSLLLLAAAAAALLSACQTAPPRHAMLDDARHAVAKLRQDTNVVRLAPALLVDAEAALRRAETAWAGGLDETDTRHLAYLALQRASIAENIAASRVADNRSQQLIAERQRVSAERAALAARAAEQQALAHAEAMREQAAQDLARNDVLQRQLALLQARGTELGSAVTLSEAHFEANGETLRGSGERTVSRIADVMRQHPERRVMIAAQGVDPSATAMSRDLGQRRARILRDALIARGVAPDRIEVPAAGEELLGYVGAASATWPKRGVDVLFSDAQGRFATR